LSQIKKKKILCFIEYYLPGIKSGGPVRTISNFVEYFGDEFEIDIVCSDRDFLDEKPYLNINKKKWHQIKKANVYYISKKDLNLRNIKKILSYKLYDLIYINGLFSFKFNILPLIFKKFNSSSNTNAWMIAPRGMLSPNAIKLKSLRKSIFICVANLLRLYKNIFFHASNREEKKNIMNNLKISERKIFIAPNLTNLSPISFNKIKIKKNGPLKLVFLSRISPMKNLDFLLRSLLKINSFIELTIFGSIEDKDYFHKCLLLKDQLPANIKVSVKDHVKNELVQKTLNKFDLFVLPTLGENFGHVIIESLSSGIPVLVSNKVPWESDMFGGIKTLPLKENLWTKEIINWSKFTPETIVNRKKAALNIAYEYKDKEQSFILHKNFLSKIIKNN